MKRHFTVGMPSNWSDIWGEKKEKCTTCNGSELVYEVMSFRKNAKKKLIRCPFCEIDKSDEKC